MKEGSIEVTMTTGEEGGRVQQKEMVSVNKLSSSSTAESTGGGASGSEERCCGTMDNRACVSFTILAIRLIIVPAISFGLIVLTTPDKSMQVMYLFILLIEGGMPTAMSTPMMFTQLNREVSTYHHIQLILFN